MDNVQFGGGVVILCDESDDMVAGADEIGAEEMTGMLSLVKHRVVSIRITTLLSTRTHCMM